MTYVSYHMDLGNGINKELRFSLNNKNTYVTHYMLEKLPRPSILKLADDMLLARMSYISKIFNEYKRSRGKFNFLGALCFINEYLSDNDLTGEFEYQNFSGKNAWAEPKRVIDGVAEYKKITKTREQLFDEFPVPGYDWLFSNKLDSPNECGELEAAHRARRQRLIFGKDLPKPAEWDYDNWRENFLEAQGDKIPIQESQPSSKELICSFLGMHSVDKYREFRIRYTTEMMNFKVDDYTALAEEVKSLMRAREEVSREKFLWATSRLCVNENTVKYFYAMFKQGVKALERYETENMNEEVTDWSEPKPLAKFYKFFNKTLHYETTVPAPPTEKIILETHQSGIDFMNSFKQSAQQEVAPTSLVFTSAPLTENDIFPVAYGSENHIAEKREDGTIEKGSDTKIEQNISNGSSRIDDTVEATDNVPTLVNTTPTEQTKPTLSYAKIVEKFSKTDQQPAKSDNSSPSPRAQRLEQNLATSANTIPCLSGNSENSENSYAPKHDNAENVGEWKEVVSKATTSNSNKKGKSKSIGQKQKETTQDVGKMGITKSEERYDGNGNEHQKSDFNISKGSSESENGDSLKSAKKKKASEFTTLDANKYNIEKEKDFPSTPAEEYSASSTDKEEVSKPTKTSIKKAKKAAKAAKREQGKGKDNATESTIEKLVMIADDNSFVEAKFDVQIVKSNDKEPINPEEENGKSPMESVEAQFSDGLATTFVNNALLAAQNLLQMPETVSHSNIQYTSLPDEPEDEGSDAYVPGQTITHDYRPGVRRHGNGSECSSCSSAHELPSLDDDREGRLSDNNNRESRSAPTYPTLFFDTEFFDARKVNLAKPTPEFVERACNAALHDMFRRLKYLADKKANGGLRNVEHGRRPLIQKRLQKFQNVYVFRLRVAKAMLYILDNDVAAESTNIREKNVIKDLLLYIGEPVDSNADTLKGRKLDRIAEHTRFADNNESDLITRGLRYIDLRVSELEQSEPLRAQYAAIGDRVFALMKEQEVLLKIIGNSVDFRGYEEYL